MQFTVVKFPSSFIGLYSLTGPPPQEAYWERIRNHQREFEHELLGVMATRIAKIDFDNFPSIRALLVQACLVVRREIRVATEDWPLFSAYWLWRQARGWRRTSIKRGLQPRNARS
jgi:hypothetical protein